MEARNTARLAVAQVVRRIEAVGLKVALQKTEAVFLHDDSHGAPPETQLPLGKDTLVSVGSSFKYLGLWIYGTWGFREHFALLTPKVAKASAALGNLLPNLGGPGGVVRRLWCGTVQAMTLYRALVWAERVMGDRVLREMLRRIQRPMALRAARAYRTVSHRAATILAGLPFWELVARSHAEVYRRVRQLRETGNNIPIMARIKQQLRCQAQRLLLVRWRRHLTVEETHVGRRTVEAIAPRLSDWLTKSQSVSFRMTRVLTEYGCFGEYLHRIGKEGFTSCHHCEDERNTAQHTLDSCPAWAEERRALTSVIGFDLSPRAVVAAMLEGEVKWEAVASFCETVMSRKEAAERESERERRVVRQPCRRRRRRLPAGQPVVSYVAGGGAMPSPPPSPPPPRVGNR
ncbi:uncharacterized protein [Anoplolepis gracilipes]|uniref:uncharacterized protein n=1 Tax=Anoplolepis gracilipes TaxID=354296 RepID=UPI003BA2AB97